VDVQDYRPEFIRPGKPDQLLAIDLTGAQVLPLSMRTLQLVGDREHPSNPRAHLSLQGYKTTIRAVALRQKTILTTSLYPEQEDQNNT
jgi:hypothetical protein